MANAWLIRPEAIAAVVASSTAPGRTAAHVANDFAGVVWRAAGAGHATLTIDLGEDRIADTIALFGATGALPGWLLRIRAATQAQGSGLENTVVDSGVVPFLAGAEMTHDGRGIAVWGGDNQIAARYWHFDIDAGAGTVEIARVVIGRRIRLARNFAFGAGFGVKDLGSIEWSRLGVMNRRRGAKLRTVSLTFNSIHKDEVEQAVQPLLEHVGVTDPIALVTDPSPHPMRQRRCFFGPLTGDTLATSWRRADAFSAPFNLVSLF